MNNRREVHSKTLGFSYEIVRSQRKTAAIHVTLKGVQVRIPKEVSDGFAESFVQSKSSWVRKKLSEQLIKTQGVPRLNIGSSVLWLGKDTLVRFEKGSKWSLQHLNDHFMVTGMHTPNEDVLIALFTQFYQQQAKQILTPLTHKKAKEMGLQDQLTNVKFRRTKRKWGHCTSKGVIQFNWLVMGAPESVIEYLVVHEVAHLKHQHHQAKYWTFVERHCPCYQKEDRWLKENGHRLSWC